MDRRIIIASDSTTDLSEELVNRYQIKILPLMITLGEKVYKDGLELTPDMIYQHYNKTKELPKTSAANITDLSAFFEKHTKDGNDLIFFTISSYMSSTYNNACIAAQDFQNVYVVDTKNLSTGGGLLVIEAVEMAMQGIVSKEIVRRCEELALRVDASFIVDDLEFLHKGGRCSSIAALGANLLHIKPCISVRNGTMSIDKKYRGSFESVLKRYIQERIGDGTNIELERVFVTHAGCSEEVCSQCVEQVKNAAPFEEIFCTQAGCTISSHCGKNTLGILFIRKKHL